MKINVSTRPLTLIAYLVILALLCINVSISYASNDEIDSHVTILRQLNVLSEDFSVSSGDKVTKELFCKQIVGLMGLRDAAPFADYEGVKFIDLLDYSEGTKSIELLAKLGIVSGDGRGRFYPNKYITFDEAIAILVKALGYELKAKNIGGYPTGYIAVAAECGILKSVSTEAGKEITTGQVVELLYNSLEVDVMQSNSINFDQLKINIEKGRNVLTAYLKVFKVIGQVTANEYTSLESDRYLQAGKISIDDKEYTLSNTYLNASGYLGCRVLAYYKEEASGESSILYIEKYKNEELTIEADKINDFSDYKFTYERESKDDDETVVIDRASYVVFNGKATNQYTKETMMPQIGNVRLIDSDDDGSYDVVLVTSYANYVVSFTNEDTIYNKYDSNVIFDLSDSSISYSLKNSSGDSVDISDLKEGSVISVAESIDGEMISIIVSENVINGAVTEILNDGAKKGLIINNETYYISKSFNQPIPDIGDEGGFILDVENKVAYFSRETSGQWQYGFMINAKETQGVAGTFTFRIMNTDSTKIDYETTEKVKFNDEPNKVESKELKEKAQLFSNRKAIPQLIQFILNKDNKISELRTALGSEPTDKDQFHKSYEGSSVRYKSNYQTFGYMKYVDSGTKVFIVPASSDPNNIYNEDDYYVKDKSYFLNDTQYSKILAYNTLRDKAVADVIVYERSIDPVTAIPNSTSLFVVDKLTEVVQDDGDKKYKIYGYKDGAAVSFIIKDAQVFSAPIVAGATEQEMQTKWKTWRPKKGDVVRLYSDINTDIRAIELIYEFDTKKFYGGKSVTSNLPTAVEYTINYAEPVIKDGTYLTVDHIGTNGNKTVTGLIIPAKSIKMTLIDAASKQTEITIKAPAAINDILDSATVGEEKATRVIYMSRGTGTDFTSMIILKYN